MTLPLVSPPSYRLETMRDSVMMAVMEQMTVHWHQGEIASWLERVSVGLEILQVSVGYEEFLR